MKKEQSIFSTMKTFALSHSTIVFLIFLLTFNCIITPNFINATTLWNLIVQTTPLLLVALGMTFVISSGGINIAVGSLMAVAGMLVVRLMEVTSIGIALAITIFTITLVGGVIGFVIVRFDIQPIIITLAFLIGARGIARMLGYGSVLHYDSAEFGMLTLTRIKNVPIQLIYVIVFAAIFIFIAKKNDLCTICRSDRRQS